jgi:hypothetical protein
MPEAMLILTSLEEAAKNQPEVIADVELPAVNPV